MSRYFLEWTDDPASDRGLRFLDEAGTWSFNSYQFLALRSFKLAALLRSSGAKPGATVCIVLPTGPDLVASILGTWASGGTICPIVPPTLFEEEDHYIQYAARLLVAAKPDVVVADAGLRPLIEAAVRRSNISGLTILDPPAGTDVHEQGWDNAGEIALLQFTSGSSGDPRGVRVSFENLAANIRAIRNWIRMGADDVTATWLPLYHDMGLIGCLLTPIVNRSDVWIMRPDQFVRDPSKWIECFGHQGASLCAAPNFGYAYAARKVHDDSLAGADFSNWRVAIAGAEPVDAAALRSLSDRLKPFGFSSRAFLPAYGLAEATLAVTGRSPAAPAPLSVELDWASLRFAGRVEIKSQCRLDDPGNKIGSGWLVSSGQTHPGMAVRILNNRHEQLLPDTLGEIFVSGPSVAQGYSDTKLDTATRFSSEGVYTGDAGFIHEGELFVVGRIADSIKVRGRTVYAEDMETRIAAETGLPRGRFVVIAMPGKGSGSVLSIAEGADPNWASAAATLLKGVVGNATPVRVGIGPRGTIRRTSSGKPKRRLMWELDRLGTLKFDHAVDL